MTEKDLNRLPIGTILELECKEDFRARWRDTLRKYIHVEPNWWAHASYGVDSSKRILECAEIKKILVPKYEEKRIALLDNVELKYLKSFVIPLKEVGCIVKRECFWGDRMVERLCFRDKSHHDLFALPPFEKGTKYTGLEKDVNYTIEELGIERPKKYILQDSGIDFGIDFSGIWSGTK